MKKIVLALSILLLAVGLLPASEVTIGTGNQSARYPVDMYYLNSLYECVYLSSEINTGVCQITAITFYNNFTTNVGAKPTKIWLGNTALANLSTGWVPSTSMTQVFDGNVTYPSGINTITITFSAPFAYTGSNLVMMANRPMDTAYYASSENFYCQTIGTNRARRVRSDTVNYNPASPPTTSTLTGQFPKTTFTYSVEPMGNLQGTIYGTGGLPLANASVAVVGTSYTFTTGSTGAYNFAYLTTGSKDISVACHGYVSQTQSAIISDGVTTTLDFNLVSLPQITLSGRVVGSDAPEVGLVGAAVGLTGYDPYNTVTGAGGYFTIPGVYANNAYDYTVSYTGYQSVNGQLLTGITDLDMGTIILSEVTSPPVNVTATEAANFLTTTINWDAPGTFLGEWIHYDDGINASSIGTGGAADFSVAIRYAPGDLTAYAGTSLHAVKVWPASTGTFSIRVWTGGTSTVPGNLVVDQTFTPILGVYNTVLLSSPVYISGTEELWFGMRCNVTTGYPAGCDAGPQDEGFGNMIYFNNAWSSLTALAPTLTFNWNIQGYVGYSAPTRENDLIALGSASSERSMTGYKAWRLLQGDEANQAAWTLVTPTTVTETTCVDPNWYSLPAGVYKYAVKSVYTNDTYSAAAFSNVLENGMMGILSGVVTEAGTGLPVEGATVAAGVYSGTTNATGNYSFPVYQGTYTVTCVKTGYQSYSQSGLYIQGSYETTLNIALTEVLLPVTHLTVAETMDQSTVNVSWYAAGTGDDTFVDGFESYPDFNLEFDPWYVLDVDHSVTYGLSSVSYPNESSAMAYIIFNPSATTPALTTLTAHGGAKMAACFASTVPLNDDWMIAPQYIPVTGDVFSFWARSYVSTYGLERFYVAVSTTGTDPSNFTVISGPNYVEAPVDWTQYTYDLSAYIGTPIYIGIRCVSNDAYIFFVDDVLLGSPAKMPAYKPVPVVAGIADKAAAPAFARAPQMPKATHTAYTANDRVVAGYQVWRLPVGQETNEATWELLTPTPITLIEYMDTNWGSAVAGDYRWAVKAIYSGGYQSLAKISTLITRVVHTDIAAVLLGGNNEPVAGVPVVYTLEVQNSGNTVLLGSSYTVRLMNGSQELDSAPGVDLAPGETHGFPLQWIPVDAGPVVLTGLVDLPNDTVPTNNETDGLVVTVQDPNLPVVLSSFTALVTATNNVQLVWVTQSESGMMGYRVYRGETAQQSNSVQITPVLIPATNTSVEHSYEITDDETVSGNTYYYWLESVEFAQSSFHGPVSVTVLGDVPPVLPEVSTLHSAYPNPFKTGTNATIEVAVKEGETGSVSIYNVAGQMVRSYTLTEGYHTLLWNGRDARGKACGSGIYFYRLSTPSATQTRKLVLTK